MSTLLCVHALVHAQTFSSDLQHKMCSKRIDMYTLKTETASVVVFPFVQCGLVAPLVVDGSPDTESPLCSVGVNGFTGSGSMCSEELVIVLCGARIGGHCGWPQCLGPAPCTCKSTCSEG